MLDKKWAILALIILLLGTVGTQQFFKSQEPAIDRVLVSVFDANHYLLPYVRVRIRHMEGKIETNSKNFGRFFDGPLPEGNYEVTVFLGEWSDRMDHVVYIGQHKITKKEKNISIILPNVVQKFNIYIYELGTKLPTSRENSAISVSSF